MKRLLFFLLILFLLIPFVAAEDNSTTLNEIYVSVDGSVDGDGSFENPYGDLRTAISNSVSNDTIYLNGGTYTGVNNTNLGISITNLTIKPIDGENVIFDANGSGIFTINNDYFSLSGITFKNAHAIEGSCFNIWSRYVTISDCDFIDDTAQTYGGAIHIRNNFLTIDKCNFINCSALVGGAAHLEGAQIFVMNSNFINCSASDAGAINWHRKSSYLYNSNFINCHAISNGGAMCANENTIVYSNITAINCTAGKGGAVIYAPEFRGSISNSLFINNSADSGSVFQIFFDSNLALSNTTLINNKASSTSININITKNDRDVEITATFVAKNSIINAFDKFRESTISFFNVTYWGIDGVMNTGDVDGVVIGAENSDDGKLIYLDNRQANQNITIEVYDSQNNMIENITNATNILGEVALNLTDLPYGDYKVKAYHNENEYYTFISNSQTFSLSNSNIKLECYDLDMYYHDGSKAIINLTNNDGAISNATVNINLNGVNYTRLTDENGLISMTINLNSGKYAINCSYVDENNKTYFSDAVIVVKSTVDGINLTKIYKNESQFYAVFTDFAGHHLSNTNVTFNINGVYYNRTTNSVGVARLNINLAQGNYTITSVNPLTGENSANWVCVLPSITENSDLELYYRNGSKYVVRAVGSDGNPVGAGVDVAFNINGVFYKRTTDENGYARLNINLQPGNYVITAEYNDCMVSNNILVKPVLYAGNLTKKYGSPDPFLTKLVDGRGMPLAGENITYNINGVFYNRSTDENGVARLNINLQSGEYLITSSYNQANIANRVTVI